MPLQHFLAGYWSIRSATAGKNQRRQTLLRTNPDDFQPGSSLGYVPFENGKGITSWRVATGAAKNQTRIYRHIYIASAWCVSPLFPRIVVEWDCGGWVLFITLAESEITALTWSIIPCPIVERPFPCVARPEDNWAFVYHFSNTVA